MLSRPGNIARTLCSTWRLVRFEGEGAHSPSKQKMFSIKFTRNAEKNLFFFIISSIVSVEKDESVSRAYLSELQNITLNLKETEQRLMTAIETPPPTRLSADGADVTRQIEAQKVGLSFTCRPQQVIALPFFDLNIK